jgi:hypothetical protein
MNRTRTKRPVDPVQRAAYSIPGFCRAYGISRRFYFRLRDEGNSPREMRLGRRVLITVESATAWARAHESAAAYEGVKMPTDLEIEMYKRRIICTIMFHDDEQQLPANYVARDGQGKFAAIVHDENSEPDFERSIGIFDTVDDAIKAIWKYQEKLFGQPLDFGP